MTKGLPSSRLLHRSMLASIALSASLGHAATFTVNTNADWNAADASDGLISLREAIQAANTNAPAGDAPAGDSGQDIIAFDLSGASSNTITLTEGEFAISEDLQINAAPDVTIDANNASRIFSIDNSSTVSANGLTLTNGSSTDDGGAIKVNAGSSLSISQSNLTANSTSAMGGAIAVATNASLTIDQSTLNSNSSSVDGGAIWAESSVAVNNSTLSNNQSGGDGGAIAGVSGSALSLDSNTFSSNSAVNDGGAIWVGGSLTLTGSTLNMNSAGLSGGAIAVAAGATADLTDGLLENNSAAGDTATEGGGALYNAGTLTVSGTRLEGNMATGASGSGGGLLNANGIATVTGGFWKGNMAPRAGGAIEDWQDSVPAANSLTLTGIDFFQNITGETGGSAANPGNGGALHITGNGRVTIERSSAVENSAANEGGALWNHNSGELTVINSTISGNSAPTGGGLFTQETATTRLLHVTIANNAVTGDGGGIQHGGTDAQLNLENSIVSDNTADGTGPDVNGSISAVASIIFNPDGLEGPANNDGDGNFVGVFPNLADIAYDGTSQTRFHAVSALPALDNADETLCTEAGNVDQRGLTRPVDGTDSGTAVCDIGAYERTEDLSITLVPVEDRSGVKPVVADEDDVVALIYTLDNTTDKIVEITELSGTLQGNGNFDTGLENIRLFLDDGSGEVDAGDSDITSRVVITVDNAASSFTITLVNGDSESNNYDPITIAPGTSATFMLVVDVSTAELEASAAHLILPGIALLWLRRYRKTALAALILALLTACGGGSSDDGGGFDDSALGGESNSYRFTLRSISAQTQGDNDLVLIEDLPVTGELLLRDAE